MTARGIVMAFVVTALFASMVFAQMPGQGPRIGGLWNPQVGSGAVYEMTDQRGRKREMEIAIVGTESHQGKPGHWVEITVLDPGGKVMVMKRLMIRSGDQLDVARVIMQRGDEAPMEMPVGMGMGPRQESQSADVRKDGTHLGTETVTTPAGTFTCEHYRDRKGEDVWISENVPPYGLVKSTSRTGSMTVLRVLTDAKTKIRGTPRMFNPADMMRNPG